MTTATLTPPKYVEEANAVLATLAAAPNQTWTKTQRELATQLELPQPVVSLRIKLLLEHGRIRKGAPLPMRGRNHALVVVDTTPLSEDAVRRPRTVIHLDDDKPRQEEGQVPSMVLGEFSAERIGHAIMQTLQESWQREEANARVQAQQNEAIRQFRTIIQEMKRQKEETDKRLGVLEREKADLRRTLNELIVTVNNNRSKGSPRGTARVAEMLDEESRNILNSLIREKPGDYRNNA